MENNETPEVGTEEKTNEEEVVEETTEETPVEETTEEVAVDEEKEQLKKDNGILQRKLTKALKPNDKPAATQEGLSQNDMIYIAKADIHEDDIEEVTKHAKANGVTAKEAHAYLKPIFDVKTAERTTAEATQVQGGARGANKTSGDALLDKAQETGEVPDTVEGMKKLAEARLARRKEGK